MRGKNRGRGGVLHAVRHAGTDSGAACAGTTLAAAAGGPADAGAVCGFKGCNSHSHMPCSWNYIEFSREQLYGYGADCDAVCCCRYNSFPCSCRSIFRAALLPVLQAFEAKVGQTYALVGGIVLSVILAIALAAIISKIILAAAYTVIIYAYAAKFEKKKNRF